MPQAVDGCTDTGTAVTTVFGVKGAVARRTEAQVVVVVEARRKDVGETKGTVGSPRRVVVRDGGCKGGRVEAGRIRVGTAYS